MARTIIALFGASQPAREAIAELLNEPTIQCKDVSLVTSHGIGAGRPDLLAGADRNRMMITTIEAGAIGGLVAGGIIGCLAGLGFPVFSDLGPVLVGPILATLGGAAVGGALGAASGGLLGGLASLWASDEIMHVLAEGSRHGDALVAVVVPDPAVDHAEAILRRRGAANIQKRIGTWRNAGWAQFNPSVELYRGPES